MSQTVSYKDQHITPSKVVCVGRNYVAHIQELGNEVPDSLVVFVKPSSSISSVLYAYHDEPLHFEAELAFLIKNGAFEAVAFGLDLTKRNLQSKLKSKGLPWERAKAFDGASLFSDFVMFDSLEKLSLRLEVDSRLQQQGGVDLMIAKPADILEEISSFMSLNDGDIVMTGTPAGVGPVQQGATYKGTVLSDGSALVSQSWIAN